MTVTQDVLTYWFGDSEAEAAVLEGYAKLWFGKDEQVDREIRERFGAQVEAAQQHGLLQGEDTLAHRYLATVLLLDQFTRNIYRGSAQAFASDEQALGLSLAALDQGLDQQLRPIERTFLYLPLEHSEDIGMQNRSVELFASLRDLAPEGVRSSYESFYDYAVRHQQIIERFGRFPHRNALLGRESTPEELDFLLQPNSSF